MGLFSKLFGSKKKDSEETVERRGTYMPELNIPIDEKFTIHFKKNGGKFLYCDSEDEIFTALNNIIIENSWQNKPFLVLDQSLQKKFTNEIAGFTHRTTESEVFFTPCEHLIAQNGSILVCSNQLNDCKLNDLPSNVIIYAKTSQLVESIGAGLKVIKKKYPGQIPTNITTLKHFMASEANDDDFLTYGSSSKNLYLLLLEDL